MSLMSALRAAFGSTGSEVIIGPRPPIAAARASGRAAVAAKARRMGSRRRSVGAMMMEVSMALLIAALAAVGTQREIVRNSQINSANLDADLVAMYRQALQNYTDEFYPQLQFGQPIVKGTVTIPTGAGAGTIYEPTVANLIALGYLPASFQANLLTVADGALQHSITLQPAGCTGMACNVEGLVFIDRPVTLPEAGAGVNSLVLGQMMQRIGGAAGSSIDSTSGLVGASGSWTLPNPIAGAPAGVFGARFGSSTSSLGGFVHMNETRDPNFQNAVTIGGAANIGGALTANGAAQLNGATTVNNTLTVVGQTTANGIEANGRVRSAVEVGASDTLTCLRAALTASGNILSNAADCITRVSVTNAGVDLNSSTGVNRVSLSADNGSITARNGGGAQTVLVDGDTGRVTSQSLLLQMAMIAGTPCAANNEIVQDAAPSGTVLICRGGVWKRPGLDEQPLESPCFTAGTLAQTSTSEALICRGGRWRLLNDRVSSFVAMDVWSGNGNGSVPQPICGINGTPDISVAALQGGADYGGAPPRNRFEFRVSGSGPWTISPVMVDGTGTAYGTGFGGASYDFGWTATTYCRYAA